MRNIQFKSVAINMALLLGSVLFVLVCLEIFMRVFGIGWPLLTRVDEMTGHSLRPNAQGWNVDEQRAYVQINSDGWRDKEHGENEGVRVAVLGDSFTEARQVDINDTFWSNISCAEVLNFGVSGFGTAQEYLVLRDRVMEYDPDIVVLAFFPGNDVINNSRELETGQIPYYENGDFIFDFRDTDFFRSQQKWHNKILMNAVNYSRVMQLVNRMRKISTVRQQEEVMAQIAPVTDPFSQPSDGRWERAWKTTEQLIGMMNDISPEFVVMMVSAWQQVHPDPVYREGLDIWYPNNRIKALAQREGFTFVDPVPAMQLQAEEAGVLLHGFAGEGRGHWNEKGHAFAGKLLSQEVCELVDNL